MDEKTLKEMIEEQKKSIERAQTQLKKLYEMAKDMGLQVDEISVATNSSTKQYIEEQRRQIMKRANAVREQAMAQAQKALDGMPSSVGGMKMPTMPSLTGMGSLPTMPNKSPEFNLEELKSEFEKTIGQYKGEVPIDVIEKMRKKLSGEEND